MSDSGLSNGWNTLNNNRLLDPNNQLNHLNNINSNELIANNLSNLTNLNQLSNANLYSAPDSNDSNDEDSRDSLRGSNSEINLNGDGEIFLFSFKILKTNSLSFHLHLWCKRCRRCLVA